MTKNTVLRGGDWSKITFVVFDLPIPDEPYEKRLKKLKELNLPEAKLTYSCVNYGPIEL